MPDTLVALRIGTAHWLKADNFTRLLTFLAQQPDAVDELVFFTSTTHAPLPLKEVARRAQRLAEIVPQAQQRGYRVGINVLTSMGHHEEDLPHSLVAPWPRVTDPAGAISRGSFCPGSPELLDYVAQVYTLTAQAHPDLIWIDDDVRLMGHMPIRVTCFCDDCITRFNAEQRASFTRPTLVAAMAGAPTTERDQWRDRWLAHNRALITGLLHVATQAAHGVDSEVKMGFMTGDRFYEGYAFREWAAALVGESAEPPRWRPGGGFYTDDEYMGLVDKAHAMGRQVSQLPAAVTVIQSEIENFPYQRLRKSVAITLLESVVHMAAGTTGTAFNILGMQPDPLDEYRPFLDQIANARPFYAALRAAMGRTPALGVWPAWHDNIFADHGVDGDWLSQNRSVAALRQPYVLGEVGLPMAYGSAGASVTVLAGPLPAAFSPDQLQSIFRGGVLLDGAALQSLTRLGLDAWAGVRVAETFEQDRSEVLTDHPLNGRFGGWSRDCRQSFWAQSVHRLAAIAPRVETLARLTDYADQDWGPTMTAFENPLGGRVVVMGYYPWTLLHNLAKSSQLKAVCRWLSRDTLPAVAESYARTVIWARAGVDGRLAVVVLNASLDPVTDFVLRVQATVSQATCLSLTGQTHNLHTEPAGAQHVRVTIPRLDPWSVHLLQF